jgi:DNA-binding transcriptional ArsR family regulator
VTDALWSALVDPHRRAVLDLLRQRPCAVGEMAELDAWLAPYRRLWNDRLDVLGRHLDSSEET